AGRCDPGRLCPRLCAVAAGPGRVADGAEGAERAAAGRTPAGPDRGRDAAVARAARLRAAAPGQERLASASSVIRECFVRILILLCLLLCGAVRADGVAP